MKTAAVTGEVSRVQILDDVDSVLRDPWVEDVERSVHVWLVMTAIVDDNVGVAEFGEDLGHKTGVGLTGYAHMDLILFHLLAVRIEVDAADPSEGSQIAPPQLQRSAFTDADFEQG